MKFAIAGCSDPIGEWMKIKLPQFRTMLEEAGHEVDERASRLDIHAGRTDPRERARLLNELFEDESIDAIVDVSGGDHANEVLDLLDYELIASNAKPYAGYSDNSVTILALRELAGLTSTWWHADRVLTRGIAELEAFGTGERFRPQLQPESDDDGTPPGDILLGGNVRCVAKLAGTRYWPSVPSGAGILLEGRSNSLGSLATYLTQLRHAGLFDNASTLVLGQLTDIDDKGKRDVAVSLAREIVGLPLWYAPGVGHSDDCEPWTVG